MTKSLLRMVCSTTALWCLPFTANATGTGLPYLDNSSAPVQIAQAESDINGNQDSAVQTGATERRYLVEVILFNNVGALTDGGEIWHRIPSIRIEPELADPQRFTATPTEVADEQGSIEDDPVLVAELVELEPLLSRLNADPRYEVVTHIAWTQPLSGQRDSTPVDLKQTFLERSLSEDSYPNPTISASGNIQVYENTLLYVDIDVFNEYLTEAVDYSVDSLPTRPAGLYQLREKRRVKLNEIHYFDHPFFGALVRVSRVEPG